MAHSPTSMPPPPSPTAGTALPENANVELDIDGPTQQQRVTVFFRGLLLFPHYVVTTGPESNLSTRQALVKTQDPPRGPVSFP